MAGVSLSLVPLAVCVIVDGRNAVHAFTVRVVLLEAKADAALFAIVNSRRVRVAVRAETPPLAPRSDHAPEDTHSGRPFER